MRLHFWKGATRLLFKRDANPGCGFLPQHENDTQPGMECQDAVADGENYGECKRHLSGWGGWGMKKDGFFN